MSIPHQMISPSAEDPSAASPGPSQPCEPVEGEARIEDYLDHVCAPLVGRVSYARRQALRAELTEHLEALIEAREELGEPREEAVWSALRQFGDPTTLSRQWLNEWERTQLSPETMWEAARRGMRTFGPAGLVGLLLAGMLRNDPNPIPFVLIPLVAGFVSGFRVRRWAMLSGCAGAGSVTLACTLMTLLGGVDAGQTPFAVLTVIGFLLWVPLSCVAGELGGWARRRSLRRPQPWRAQRA